MPHTHIRIDPAKAHEVKVAIVWWILVAGLCLVLAQALAAAYVAQ